MLLIRRNSNIFLTVITELPFLWHFSSFVTMLTLERTWVKLATSYAAVIWQLVRAKMARPVNRLRDMVFTFDAMPDSRLGLSNTPRSRNGPTSRVETARQYTCNHCRSSVSAMSSRYRVANGSRSPIWPVNLIRQSTSPNSQDGVTHHLR